MKQSWLGCELLTCLAGSCAAEDEAAAPAAGSSAAAAAPTATVGSKRPAVLADGTYATQVRGGTSCKRASKPLGPDRADVLGPKAPKPGA